MGGIGERPIGQHDAGDRRVADRRRYAVGAQHDDVAILHGVHQSLHADHRGDVEGAGHDRGVAGAAAAFRYEREDAAVM